MRLTISRTSPSNSDGPVHLHLAGALDAGTRYLLLDAATTAFLISRALIIDASGIDAVDAHGLRALADVRSLAETEGARVEICDVSPELREAFEYEESRSDGDEIEEGVQS